MLKDQTINLIKTKKILITGHTGFQGYWLTHFLKNLGCKKIYGISLRPNNFQKKLFNLLYKITEPYKESIFCDISNKKFINYLEYIKPDLIFHLASQPLVNLSYINPSDTFNTNINGSINLLEWLRIAKKKVIVTFITSDKCYQPSNNFLKEDSTLKGVDPYSASKSIQEILVNSYYQSFYKKNELISINTVRSGNIYGGGDFTPGRLIPDLFCAYRDNKKISIRNINGIRPWQYVLDSIWGYLLACQFTLDNSGYASFNFGPGNKKKIRVNDIIKIFESFQDYKFKISNNNTSKFKESDELNLDSNKSLRLLKWKNKKTIYEGLEETINWYKELHLRESNIENFSSKLITDYLSK